MYSAVRAFSHIEKTVGDVKAKYLHLTWYHTFGGRSGCRISGALSLLRARELLLNIVMT